MFRKGVPVSASEQVQASFADGLGFVPLVTVADPELVGRAMMTALGLAEGKGAQPPKARWYNGQVIGLDWLGSTIIRVCWRTAWATQVRPPTACAKGSPFLWHAALQPWLTSPEGYGGWLWLPVQRISPGRQSVY